ncbi:MAG: flagellar hook capping protein [Clostridia bacterium]|nr:flagellar hook capping protein [Clostridia bacterium]
MSILPASNQTGPSEYVTSRSSNKLDKDAFLKILVSQLSNQDPLNPMEDKDFIAQLAQFSVLEQMISLHEGFSFSQACELVGQRVYRSAVNNQGELQTVFGQVTLALMRDGKAWLEVDGQQIPFDEHIVVYTDDKLLSAEAVEPSPDTSENTDESGVKNA